MNWITLFYVSHNFLPQNYKKFFNEDIKLKFETSFAEDFELLEKHGFKFEL